MFNNFNIVKDLIKDLDFLVVNDDVKVYLKNEEEVTNLIDNLNNRSIKYSLSNTKDKKHNYEIIIKNNFKQDLKKDYPYDLVYKSYNNQKNEPFPNVVGHKKQKEELYRVIEWFKNSKELHEKGLSIPRGVILYGEPGNGKSLFMKEIIRIAEAPVFIFRGDDEHIEKGLIKIFNDARKEGHAIIIIDEIDLLINRERRVTRVLQEQLDGVESTDDLLVLTATNDLSEIPYALKRNGRLEKIIEIPGAEGSEAVELFKKHFKEFNVPLPSDFDEEELTNALDGVEFSCIKAIVNDIFLRNGFENITMEMIDKSIENITERVITADGEMIYATAVHEAGHAVMANAFPKYFKVTNAKINGGRGEFDCNAVIKGYCSYEQAIADIKVSMAGLISEKLIVGTGSRGAESDLQRARNCAYNLFNIVGYSSCWETLPIAGRSETFIKKRKMERKIERLLRKCERQTKDYLKKHINQIKMLADKLFEKKYLKLSEILSIIR